MLYVDMFKTAGTKISYKNDTRELTKYNVVNDYYEKFYKYNFLVRKNIEICLLKQPSLQLSESRKMKEGIKVY